MIEKSNFMNKEDRIKEIRTIFINKLGLSKLLNQDEFMEFCIKLTSFLNYSRYSKILNLNDVEINKLLEKSINFFQNLGLTKLDLINTLSNGFSFLDTINEPDFLNKYILLSLAENDKNTVRIELLEKNSNVLKKSLKEIYARYKLLESTNREITKNALFGENYLNFISRFVSNSYIEFNNKVLSERIPLEKLINKFPVDYSIIQSLNNSELNKNVSFDKCILSSDEKRLLAIKSYKKVNNLNELSALLDMSTSSLQRYLNEDSKKFVSEKEYLEIKKWLINAKHEGLKAGGTTSQALYNYLKDESGKFDGIKR